MRHDITVPVTELLVGDAVRTSWGLFTLTAKMPVDDDEVQVQCGPEFFRWPVGGSERVECGSCDLEYSMLDYEEHC